MKRIQLTRGKFAIVDDDDFQRLSKTNWHLRICGGNRLYAANNSGRSGKSKDRYMHRIVSGAKSGDTVDHIDGNGLNNQKSNLRIVSRRVNAYNSKISINNTSGFKGVSWHEAMNRWRARAHDENGIEIVLGYFDSRKAASLAYKNYVASVK